MAYNISDIFTWSLRVAKIPLFDSATFAATVAMLFKADSHLQQSIDIPVIRLAPLINRVPAASFTATVVSFASSQIALQSTFD